MSVSENIPTSDRIPFGQKIAFSLGGKMDYVATGLTVNVLWMPYFNIGLGINPAMLGLVLMLLRGWDAISDPLMGNISDNARTRWGRRRPFMFVGAILTAIVYPLLWRPPENWGQTATFFYLLGVGWIFFTCFTSWSMPYYGLQLELTPNYDERTRLTAWMAFFSKIVTLGGGWVMAIVTGPWFTNDTTGEADIVAGMKACSWYIAIIIVVFGLMPALFVKERIYETEAKNQSRDPFFQSIRETFRCRPLWCLIGASFFLVLGTAAISSLGQYVNIYLVNGGRLGEASVVEGWKYTAMVVCGIAMIPVWTWLSRLIDKKHLVCGLILGAIVGQLLYAVCLRPDMPYLQLIPAVLQSGALSAFWIFLPSMKADVADHDELDTTRRREGALNAFYSWFIKAALTCAMGLGGLALQFAGLNVDEQIQSTDVLMRMKWTFLILPVLIWSFSLIFVYVYPLTRTRMTEIRQLLEERRGKV